jgi:hypothetical protein
VDSALRRRRNPSASIQEARIDSSINNTLDEVTGGCRAELTAHQISSLSSLSPTGEQDPDMVRQQANQNGIPFHTQGLDDQDDKYSKTPIGVQSKVFISY